MWLRLSKKKLKGGPRSFPMKTWKENMKIKCEFYRGICPKWGCIYFLIWARGFPRNPMQHREAPPPRQSAVSMATGSNDVSIRGGAPSPQGGAAPPARAPPAPLPCCCCLPPLDRWPMQNDGCKLWIYLPPSKKIFFITMRWAMFFIFRQFRADLVASSAKQSVFPSLFYIHAKFILFVENVKDV